MEDLDSNPENTARICALNHYALLSFFSLPSSHLEHLILLQFLEVNTSEQSPKTTEPILGGCKLCLGVQVSGWLGFPTCVCVCEWSRGGGLREWTGPQEGLRRGLM